MPDENNDQKKKPLPEQMTVFEAGRLGGERTAATHNHAFYEKIGRQGGKAHRKDGQNGAPRRSGSRGSRT